MESLHSNIDFEKASSMDVIKQVEETAYDRAEADDIAVRNKKRGATDSPSTVTFNASRLEDTKQSAKRRLVAKIMEFDDDITTSLSSSSGKNYYCPPAMFDFLSVQVQVPPQGNISFDTNALLSFLRSPSFIDDVTALEESSCRNS